MSDENALTDLAVAGRIERLPPSAWHIKMRCYVGVATFFDAFDSLTIGFILPALIVPWHIETRQIGYLISIGFAGQAIGALAAGWLADRVGRIRAIIITVLIYTLMSFVCAAAQTYDQLFWARFIGGIGLGGEVPIAAAYISEIAQSKRRGRFFLLYEFFFQAGINVAAWTGAFVVPRFGWQWMFILGGVPAAIAFFLRRLCPESPRWLVTQGRLDEAEAILIGIERTVSQNGAKPLPAPPDIAAETVQARGHWTELFQGRYLRRTLVVWVLWFCTYLYSYGTTTWLPSLYHTVYNLPVQQALNYSLFTITAGLCGTLLCIFFIDITGRKVWYCGAFLIAIVGLALLLLVIGTSNPLTVAIVISLSQCGVSSTAFSLYLYTPELYPTRLRGRGVSWATFWTRVGSLLAPFLVGFIVPAYGVSGMFTMFWCAAVVAFLTCLFGAVETKGRVLEEISP